MARVRPMMAAAILLGCLVDHAAAAADADIVVEEIEPAPAVECSLDQCLAIGFAGDVATMRRRRAALGRDHLHGALGELEVAIGHQHFCSGTGQQNCCSAAVADAVASGATTADQRHLAGEAGIVLGALHVVSSQLFSCRLAIALTGEKVGGPAQMSLTSHGIACRRAARRAIKRAYRGTVLPSLRLLRGLFRARLSPGVSQSPVACR
ncbi:hypothetical protein AB7M63_000845 [Bradyrhizobium japonicum]